MKERLKKIAEKLGYRISRINNTEYFRFENLLYFRMTQVEYLDLVQIGACDGVSFDPVYDFVCQNSERIRGVVIEPLPDLFEKLRDNYRAFPKILPVNAAVHNSEREATIYRADPSRLGELPEFAVGIASFDKDHHQRSGIPPEFIIPETVSCRTFREIVEESELTKVDYLQIDTEGYDAEILLGLDFGWMTPAIIRFEHGLQSGTMSVERFQEVVDRLHAHQYELMFLDSDAVAIHRQVSLPEFATSRSGDRS